MAAHLLVVDDDALVRESIELELLDAGYQVTTASDGPAAIRAAHQQRFDLVVSDIRMPGMPGLEVLAQLKSLRPELKTIVITGYASPDTPIEALRMRVDDYLMKPFDGEVLLSSIRKALLGTPQDSDYLHGHDRRSERFLDLVSWLVEHSQEASEAGERALKLAEALGYSPSRTRRLYLAALLAEGPHRFLTGIPWLRAVAHLQERARENWDGTGPLGLQGEEIPLDSRVLAVAMDRPDSCLDPELKKLLDSENPGALPSDRTVGSENLIRLADKHRELKRSEVALELYQRAFEASSGQPEIQLAALLGRKSVLLAMGQDVAGEVARLLQLADRNGLDLAYAEQALEAAEGGQLKEAAEPLERAAKIFELWEMRSQAERARKLIAPVTGPQAPSSPIQQTQVEVEILLFGGLRIVSGETTHDDESWVARKDRSLLAYLAYHAGEILHEDRLIDLFWEKGGKKGRHSLHNAISQIRKTLASVLGSRAKKLIQKRRDGYLFGDAVSHRIDVQEFSRHLERGRQLAGDESWSQALEHLQKADALYTGEFLAGTYESWATPIRVTLGQQLTECRQLLASHFTRVEKHEIALQLWERVLEHDNCAEAAYQGSMRCLIAMGREAEAIKVYHRCVRTLKAELELGPPPELVRLYLDLIEKSGTARV